MHLMYFMFLLIFKAFNNWLKITEKDYKQGNFFGTKQNYLVLGFEETEFLF